MICFIFHLRFLQFTVLCNLDNTYLTKMCYELTALAIVASHHTYFIKYIGDGLLGNTAHRQTK